MIQREMTGLLHLPFAAHWRTGFCILPNSCDAAKMQRRADCGIVGTLFDIVNAASRRDARRAVTLTQRLQNAATLTRRLQNGATLTQGLQNAATLTQRLRTPQPLPDF